PEERIEDVAEPAEPLEAGARGPAIDAGTAEHVVALAPLRVRQDLVRLAGLLESVRGSGVLVDVGMPLLRELAERALDLGVRRLARDAEDLIQITLGRGHRPGSLREGSRFGRDQDVVEHRGREDAREGVLLARVIRPIETVPS